MLHFEDAKDDEDIREHLQGARLHQLAPRMMRPSTRITSAIFDVLLAPFGHGPAWFDLLVWPVVAGVLALLVYKRVSNQAGIARAKDAHPASHLSRSGCSATTRWRARLDRQGAAAATARYLGYNLRADAGDARADDGHPRAARGELRVRAVAGRQRAAARGAARPDAGGRAAGRAARAARRASRSTRRRCARRTASLLAPARRGARRPRAHAPRGRRDRDQDVVGRRRSAQGAGRCARKSWEALLYPGEAALPRELRRRDASRCAAGARPRRPARRRGRHPRLVLRRLAAGGLRPEGRASASPSRAASIVLDAIRSRLAPTQVRDPGVSSCRACRAPARR